MVWWWCGVVVVWCGGGVVWWWCSVVVVVVWYVVCGVVCYVVWCGVVWCGGVLMTGHKAVLHLKLSYICMHPVVNGIHVYSGLMFTTSPLTPFCRNQ